MNKGIFLLVVTSLFIVLLAMPVLAIPIEKQKVSAIMTPTGMIGFIPPSEMKFTEGGTVHFKDQIHIITFVLTIGEQTFTGVTTATHDGTENPKGTVILHSNVLHKIDGVEGGFEGQLHMKLYNFNPVTNTWDKETWFSAAQGFGYFEGQTLVMSYEGEPWGPRTGFCLQR